MKNIVDEVRKYIFKECKKESNPFGMNAYNHHFKSVVKYARILAKERKADLEIVEIAAWLHDLGSIKGDYENHHISGQKYAEEFLKKHKYPLEKIQKVKYCIYTHRASKKIKRESVEAECISDADAMSHFDEIPSLFYLAIKKNNMDVNQARVFVKEKLQRSYHKLTKTGKEVIKSKYYSAMEIL